MNEKRLKRIKISGYKSIKECDLEIRKNNILIGANGAGKSNFIGFLKMANTMIDNPDKKRTRFQESVASVGGPDVFLRYGRKITDKIKGEFYFGMNSYEFILEPTDDNKLIFTKEWAIWNRDSSIVDGKIIYAGPVKDCKSGHFESELENKSSESVIAKYALEAIRAWQPYHFHDTGRMAHLSNHLHLPIIIFLDLTLKTWRLFLAFWGIFLSRLYH
jgi:predicted ATPase